MPEEVKIKRPCSAYFQFMNERRAGFKEKNPDMSMCQITKGLTEVWRALTEDEKKKYDELAAADKVRYEREVAEQGGSVASSKKSKASKSTDVSGSGGAPPKRGLSSYLFFCNDKRKELKEQNPEFSMTDMTKALSEAWKKLDENQKTRFEKMAAQDRERYEKQKAEFDKTGKFTPVSND